MASIVSSQSSESASSYGSYRDVRHISTSTRATSTPTLKSHTISILSVVQALAHVKGLSVIRVLDGLGVGDMVWSWMTNKHFRPWTLRLRTSQTSLIDITLDASPRSGTPANVASSALVNGPTSTLAFINSFDPLPIPQHMCFPALDRFAPTKFDNASMLQENHI
jgi:hypothetical protein